MKLRDKYAHILLFVLIAVMAIGAEVGKSFAEDDSKISISSLPAPPSKLINGTTVLNPSRFTHSADVKVEVEESPYSGTVIGCRYHVTNNSRLPLSAFMLGVGEKGRAEIPFRVMGPEEIMPRPVAIAFDKAGHFSLHDGPPPVPPDVLDPLGGNYVRWHGEGSLALDLSPPSGWRKEFNRSLFDNNYSGNWTAIAPENALQPGGVTDFYLVFPIRDGVHCDTYDWGVEYSGGRREEMNVSLFNLSITLSNLKEDSAGGMEGDVTFKNNSYGFHTITLGKIYNRTMFIPDNVILEANTPERSTNLSSASQPYLGLESEPMNVLLLPMATYTAHFDWESGLLRTGKYSFNVRYNFKDSDDPPAVDGHSGFNDYWIKSNEIEFTVE